MPAALPWFAGHHHSDMLPYTTCQPTQMMFGMAWMAKREPSVTRMSPGRDSLPNSLQPEAFIHNPAHTSPRYLCNCNSKGLCKQRKGASMNLPSQCAGPEEREGSPEQDNYDPAYISHLFWHGRFHNHKLQLIVCGDFIGWVVSDSAVMPDTD